jgi:ankyrin repeat protein
VLHLAVRCKQNQFVKQLVSVEGIALNRVNREGQSALALACDSSNSEIVKILLNCPAVNTEEVNNLLDKALTQGEKQISKLLLEAGARPSTVDMSAELAQLVSKYI